MTNNKPTICTMVESSPGHVFIVTARQSFGDFAVMVSDVDIFFQNPGDG